MAVCGRGRGAEPGPTSVVFAPPLVFVTQRTLSALAFPGLRLAGRPSPRRGGGRPAVAPHAPLPLGVRALSPWPSVGAPGAFQDVLQVPEAEQVVSFPVPRGSPNGPLLSVVPWKRGSGGW